MMPALHIYTMVVLGLLLTLAPSKAPQTRATGGFDLAVLAFVDLNGDGAYGLSQSGPEPVMPGIEIRLYQDQPPLLAFGKEDFWLATQTTNQDGYVVLRSISEGDYILIGSVTDGYLPTTPLEQYTHLEGDGGGAVLEFLFGQLARKEFTQRLIFPVVGTHS